MALQSGRPRANNPVFRQPLNDDVIQDLLPSESTLLSSSSRTRLHDCRYAVCVEKDGQSGRSPEEKNYTIRSFGNLEGLVNGDYRGFRVLDFHEFVYPFRVHQSINAATASPLTVWATSDLTTPAARISSTDEHSNAICDHLDLFRQDPLKYPILYFFIEFDGASASASSREHTSQPPDLDRVDPSVAAGGVSPTHIPASGPNVPPNEPPSTPPARPQRSNTLESGKKAVSKLTIAVTNLAGTVKDLVSPREAPEQQSVLTQLVSGIEEEDYLTSLLPSTRGTPGHQDDIDNYHLSLFERFARFFPHIDTRQRENKRSIHFRHTAMTVTPHQFCRAMEILFQDQITGIPGGLLASEMGSGKSYIILAAVAIRSLLFQSKRSVEREWEEVEARARSPRRSPNSRRSHRLQHLPRDAPRGQGLTCPTQRDRTHDVVCFCQPDGATRTEISVLKQGAALIQVPSAAMPGWIETLESAIFSRIAYNVTVLYAGPRLSSRLEPGVDFISGTRLINRWKMGAVLPEGHPGGQISNTQELDWIARPAPLSDGSLAMETYIIVTPHNSTKLHDLFSWDIRDLDPAPQNCQFPNGGLYAFPVGITFIDEAHKVLEGDSMPLQLAREHRHVRTPPRTGRPDVWLVSGTPFGAQLADLADAVSFIAKVRAADARTLHTTYEAIRPAMTNTPKATFEALFNRVFGSQLVIRDTSETTFLGSRISDVRKVQPQYISRNTPESQRHAVRMIIDTKVSKGPRDDYFATLRNLKQNTELLYLLATFPSAAKLLLDSPDIAFTDLDTRRTIRKEGNTMGEYLMSHKYFKSLAEKLNQAPRSPKLQYILDELDRMAKDNKTSRPQISQAGASANVQKDQTLKKMVIITPTLFTAVMLYVILARHHPRSGPLLYHLDLKQSQRSDVLWRFNNLRKRDSPSRIFIAPASAASEALNLQVANRLILTSPLLNVHQENQALARVNRAGQCFQVEQKVLLLEDTPLDRIVIAHRAGARFESDPFNVDESVSVTYNNGDDE